MNLQYKVIDASFPAVVNGCVTFTNRAKPMIVVVSAKLIFYSSYFFPSKFVFSMKRLPYRGSGGGCGGRMLEGS